MKVFCGCTYSVIAVAEGSASERRSSWMSVSDEDLGRFPHRGREWRGWSCFCATFLHTRRPDQVWRHRSAKHPSVCLSVRPSNQPRRGDRFLHVKKKKLHSGFFFLKKGSDTIKPSPLEKQTKTGKLLDWGLNTVLCLIWP